MATHYEHHKAWRKKNPKKRHAEKKRNYQQTQNAKNGRQLWTTEHEAMILAPDRPSDRELSKTVGRSVQAIQVHRSVLLKTSN